MGEVPADVLPPQANVHPDQRCRVRGPHLDVQGLRRLRETDRGADMNSSRYSYEG